MTAADRAFKGPFACVGPGGGGFVQWRFRQPAGSPANPTTAPPGDGLELVGLLQLLAVLLCAHGYGPHTSNEKGAFTGGEQVP